MSKKKWSKVGLVAAAAALGASLAGNYFLNARLRAMEKLVREAGAKGDEIGGAKAAKTAPSGGASAAVGTPRRGTLLPATPCSTFAGCGSCTGSQNDKHN